MATFWAAKDKVQYGDQTKNQRDIITQSIISIAFGLLAFLAFCTLRPRWTGLYAARKRRTNAASRLPELPGNFLGWIPALYRISEDEVLASAGLDALVFLAFFKMATKFLAIAFFFALVVIEPVHSHYGKDYAPGYGNDTDAESMVWLELYQKPTFLLNSRAGEGKEPKGKSSPPSTDFLWMYVVFVYLFSGIALYLIVTETKRIIRIRQGYLGSQSTITDRTVRLSGIPVELRTEEKIRETIERLEIGKVESLILCRDWKELDDLMDRRMQVLRKLEEAWTVHLGQRSGSGTYDHSNSRSRNHVATDEESQLLQENENERNHVHSYARERPTTRIWYGFLKLQSQKIDAIDYYEEKLRKLDEKIKLVRKKGFKPTPLAFVTFDSAASCQMAAQAMMDPKPMKLLAKPAPAPSDVIWRNTYLSRSNRMTRSWSITAIIILLTIFWSVLLAPLAGLLSITSIHKVWPQLADALQSHPLSKTLIQSLLPTLIISLLNVLVPYLYWWFSSLQGMISQGEVEMSLIKKNFFFTFFNLFLVFTVFGTAFKAIENADQKGDGFRNGFNDIFRSLKDTTRVAYILASSLQGLAAFYINLVILQGLGLFPFRLLEFGSVTLYPIYLMGAKTPRDYAELVQPPVFSYGFYLPQSLLIFIICTVYSVLPNSWLILFFGLIYFVIGSFTYKYQLLYAMDHREHSTGKAWSIICIRIIIGLIFFQIAMAGVLALRTAIKRSILVLPLLVGTIWFTVFFQRSYDPLMEFIALRSLKGEGVPGVDLGISRYDSETAGGRDVDESEETGLRYMNPSLIIPLEDMWVGNRRRNGSDRSNDAEAEDGL